MNPAVVNEPLPSPDEISEFAQRLGPATVSLVETESVNLEIRRSIADGETVANAVLVAAHRAAKSDAALAGEFLAHFLQDMVQLGHGALGPRFRRLLETGDLVQSVMADLWPVLSEVEFHSRAAFLSLIAQRLRWKRNNRVRALQSGRRREDLRQVADPAQLRDGAAAAGPSTLLANEEEAARLRKLLDALPEREREILDLHRQGLGIAEITARTGWDEAEARKRLKEAIRHARALLQG